MTENNDDAIRDLLRRAYATEEEPRHLDVAGGLIEMLARARHAEDRAAPADLAHIPVAGPDTEPREKAAADAPEQDLPWPLTREERLALTALSQRYLRGEPQAQPLSWHNAAELLADVNPDGRWTARRVERVVRDVHSRLSRTRLANLSSEEVEYPAGHGFTHDLIRALLLSGSLVPRDLDDLSPVGGASGTWADQDLAKFRHRLRQLRDDPAEAARIDALAAEARPQEDHPRLPDGGIRVLVADSQEQLRAALAALIQAAPGMEVAGQAADGHAAVALAGIGAPDVILMEIEMPGIDGIAATERILTEARGPVPRVLILTASGLDEHVYAAVRAGASGFLLKKETRPDRLVTAIRAVAVGNMLFSPAATRRLIEASAARRTASRPQTLDLLTPRQLEVLRHVAAGLNNAEIARQLTLTEATVKTHLSQAMTKLGLKSRAQATALAYEVGLITSGEPQAKGRP
jgi:DNA-binding NarL/FixJ family response regulator